MPSLTRALNHSIDPAVITQDTKVRLAKAAELAFPERLNQSELAAHGSAPRQSCNLDRRNKQFTTLQAEIAANRCAARERLRAKGRKPGRLPAQARAPARKRLLTVK
jgi:hypothetical protein